MITAAPIVRKPLSAMLAPGYTDYSRIYIASELNAAEYRTVLRHEQSHVWAGHNRRRPKVDYRHHDWVIATEMEIARNIYDAEDIATISAPRSRLTGAYLPNTIADLPAELLLAEEIYDWLAQNPQEKLAIPCGCKHDEKDDNGDESIPIEIIREHLDKEEESSKSEIAALTAYNAIRNRPPSLTECIDAALRHRVSSEPSYRRTSRRETGDCIMKGRISTPRPPLVEIYVDRSGSFTPDKTAEAEAALRTLLARYHASIKYDVWYFGNGKLTAEDYGGGGDTPYHLVAESIVRNSPKIAIVITDDDSVGEIVKPNTEVVCLPIGCSLTQLSHAIGGKDLAVVMA